MSRIRKLCIGAAGLALVITGIAGMSAPANASASSGASERKADSETEFVTLDFAQPVTLSDAMTIQRASGVEVQGYHFESDSITGDFWPDGGMSQDEFLADVAKKTGTAPEVTSVYVRAAEYQKAAGSLRSAALLGAELPAFDAPDADPTLMPKATQDQPTATSRAAASTTWQPTTVVSEVKRTSTNVAITGFYSWFSDNNSNPKAHPAYMASSWGMEFQYDFYTTMRPNAVGAPIPIGYGTRPVCGTTTINFKDWAVASNRPFNWFAWITLGTTPRVAAPSTFMLYGDFNDLTDPCTVSTIAVGMANPQAVSNLYTSVQLELQMYPKLGSDATSKLGAIVQPVSREHCNRFPDFALTDCMGVTPGAYPGPGPSDPRMVLNSTNNKQAPNLCWFSPSYGNTPASYYTCP